jgi:putative membrane-bound dehydrogenase-like protein
MRVSVGRIMPAAIFMCLLWACGSKLKNHRGLTAQEALSSFRLPEGFTIELVASEPLVADPVAMEVDEFGNLFVVEMHGYPLDTSGSGKIKKLEDTDADGLPDKATLFADHLKLPTGIMRWKQGWLVVDVPDILYLEDSDRDGKADIRETVLTGMALTNPQHITNTPLYGLDNWIYLAHMGIITPKVSMMFNDTGRMIRFPGAPDSPALPRNADGRNFRFRPDSRELDMLAGESQYGHSFDNWGRHFCVANADHIFHEVIGARYLRRNPDLLVADASEYISDHGDACAVFPITYNPENQLLTDRGVVTSACGITFYNGGLFPDSFNNVTFVAEPTSNIVHADRLHQAGASFRASRVYPDREFLASTDGWFRPVQMYIGPDGALYVIDYYRQIIEHPEWLSEDVIQSGALYNGSGQGRIYRIMPTGTRKIDWLQRLALGNAPVAELVQHLSSPNIWWRRQAQRLLMDRKDPAAIPLLRALVDSGRPATAVVHALRTLEGYGAMSEDILLQALRHPEAGVRENALQVSENYLRQSPPLMAALASMQDDADSRVRFQLMCTLGELDDRPSQDARHTLLLRDIEDQWMQVAALSSERGREMVLLEKILPAMRRSPSEGKALFFGNLAGLVALSQRGRDIRKITAMATRNSGPGDDWWQSALLQGLARGLTARGLPPGSLETERHMMLSALGPSFSTLVRDAALDLLAVIGPPGGASWDAALSKAEKCAGDTGRQPVERVVAFKILAMDRRRDFGSMVESVLRQKQDPAIQQAALKSYARYTAEKSAALVVKYWDSLYFPVNSLGMEILLGSAAGMHALLDAVTGKKIPTSSIPWSGKVDLMNNDDATIRARSRALLAPEIEGREKVVSDYKEALSLEGNISRGKEVFQSVCGVCHQYEGQYGKTFGPDLGSIRNRDKASIMTDILQPNRSIAVQYDLWMVVLKNGDTRSGIIHAETPTSIQLSPAGAEPQTIPRADIAHMETRNVSAMPEGLEAAISKQQMADLLAFLTGKE